MYQPGLWKKLLQALHQFPEYIFPGAMHTNAGFSGGQTFFLPSKTDMLGYQRLGKRVILIGRDNVKTMQKGHGGLPA